jgi:hypothetical protein
MMSSAVKGLGIACILAVACHRAKPHDRQRWNVGEAIANMKEPTSPDDVLGEAAFLPPHRLDDRQEFAGLAEMVTRRWKEASGMTVGWHGSSTGPVFAAAVLVFASGPLSLLRSEIDAGRFNRVGQASEFLLDLGLAESPAIPRTGGPDVR